MPFGKDMLIVGFGKYILPLSLLRSIDTRNYGTPV
jgi:hypothetical protein